MMQLKDRFRGFLPVVVDVETGGINPETDALLEIAAVPMLLDENGRLICDEVVAEHIQPFEGANLDPEALKFNKIDPFHPFRMAKPESEGLMAVFDRIEETLEQQRCTRAVLVGHNAWFDLLFVKAAVKRCGIKSPFHSFTCFDTATLAGFLLGQTVLAVALKKAGIEFDPDEAHSAIYDAEKTAELFCHLYNRL